MRKFLNIAICSPHPDKCFNISKFNYFHNLGKYHKNQMFEEYPVFYLEIDDFIKV